MFSEIFKWLIDNFPLIAIAILLMVVVWYVSEFYHTRFRPIEANVNDLKGHVNDLKSKSNCVKHESEIKTLTDIVRNVEKILLRKDATLMNELSITKSPRQLSESGRRLFVDSGCCAFLDEFTESFLDKLEGRKPITALDVENESHSLLLSLSDEDYFKPIKNFLYNNPRYNEIDIDINTLCFIMSLELRNLYLAKHPEIEVD